MKETNPYSPPNPTRGAATTPPPSSEFVRGNKRGPALYIAVGALILGFASPYYLMQRDPVGFAFPFLGSIAGAVTYRIRSKHWPIDPNVRLRTYTPAIIYIALAVAAISGLVTGGHTQAAGILIVCLLIGLAIAIGVVVSGVRRHGEHNYKS